ncbi:putative membrane protein [Phyllobacterium ifriqiyense]|uniref:Membrane protein n=1 Tax=Phyllobacterium ifriqiyense TaxID=314238 RepID=A0ABU0SDK3_9HYPH|nr:hypothetical protein [Phyllobacterium ifriqiyense]MDQ0998829.1 putative membrane protein [Phyllobacterium ifriqiyense]
MIMLLPVLTMLAALGSGIMAGLFFAFSSFIMTAFSKLPPEQGIAAMNSINVTILNATFGMAFFGTALLCIVLGIQAISPASPEGTALWTRYFAEWVPWNHVRTFASTGSLIAFILAYGKLNAV